MKNTAKNNCIDESHDKMETVGDRLSIFLDKIGSSRKDIAQEANVVFSTVSNYLEKDELPGPKFLTHLVQRHRVNVEWLLSGQGPMTLNEAGQECVAIAGPSGIESQLAEANRRLIEQILANVELRDMHSKWREQVLKTLAVVAKAQGLTSDQHMAIMNAVIDPAQAMAEMDIAVSHQKAVGD